MKKGINIKPLPDENLPCDTCIKCMMNERWHLDNEVNDSATVVIQSLEKLILDNKPILNSSSKMMKGIIALNPRLQLDIKSILVPRALKFFRFLWEKAVRKFFLLMIIEMIIGINRVLRILPNAAQGDQTHNANEL